MTTTTNREAIKRDTSHFGKAMHFTSPGPGSGISHLEVFRRALNAAVERGYDCTISS